MMTKDIIPVASKSFVVVNNSVLIELKSVIVGCVFGISIAAKLSTFAFFCIHKICWLKNLVSVWASVPFGFQSFECWLTLLGFKY